MELIIFALFAPTAIVGGESQIIDPILVYGMTNPSCGSVVNESATLSANLDCSDHGIIVNASDISIALNGYSIIGPGSQSTKSGIIVPEYSNVTVYGPGRIVDFQSGVFATGSDALNISSIFLDRNRIGVYFTGSTNSSLQHNMVRNNDLGMAAHSSSGILSNENYFHNNSLAGISLINTGDSAIKLNYINGSQNGIFTDPASISNGISFNFLRNIIDINSANGLPNDMTNNTYEGNFCELSLPSGICRGVTE
ncbi:MAG TPA: NosD domain-containing protein [Nitrososphaeraceae archaeon]|nr:NosD domain-containing protein [Nitrososphaeraceae archaeon]